jgi:hypothetical protein
LGVFVKGLGVIIEPEFYSLSPDRGADIDLPCAIEFSPAVKRLGWKAVKVVYWAGYKEGAIPSDLASACLELASWNMNRYRSKQIGMKSNIRGNGRDGEHFESSMPENVKLLLEHYRRKTI